MTDSTLTRRTMIRSAMPVALLGTTGLAFAQDPAPAHRGISMPAGLAQLFKDLHADGEYKLPKLPYAYDALEPHIDAQTMELHHSKHHQGYVNNLNKALKELTSIAGVDDDGHHVEGLQRDISFNAGGHIMHTIFWAIMGPNGGGQPTGGIAEAINNIFGSYDAFKTYFTKIATGVKGSGWAVLALEPMGGRLMTYAMNDQDLRFVPGAVPVLCVDVWEHAYYLKYQNRRADYVNAWFNTINWEAVNALYKGHRHPLSR